MKNQLSTTSPTRQTLLAAIILTALALLTYANTFNAPFVFDDEPNILENPLIRVTELTPEALTQVFKCREKFRPVANLSLAANYYFHGYDVSGYHAVNLAIHALTALLVFLLARLTLRLCGEEDRMPPFFAAALWLVNPVHTQSITYIVQRMNSLAALFFLLTLVCYARARTLQNSGAGRKRVVLWFAGCGLSGLLGLFSKEITAVLPAIIFLYEWFFFQNLDRVWLKKQLPRIGALIILLTAIAFIYMDGNVAGKLTGLYEKHDFTPGQRLLTEAGVVIYYFSLLLFPHPDRLTLVYDFPLSRSLTSPAMTVPALAALMMAMIGAVYAAAKHRLPSFAVLWFLITLAIESSIIGLALIFEHRTYLPSVVPIIVLTGLTCRHVRPKVLAAVILCAAIGVSALWTYRRNSVWNSGFTLWRDNVAKAPEKALVYNNLGLAYKKLGRHDEAMRCYGQALEKSTQPDEVSFVTLCNIGDLLLDLNRSREAADCFTAVLKAMPEYDNAHLNLGVALQRLGSTDEAMASYNRALEVNPELEKAYNNLGNAWFVKGDTDRAAAMFNQALAIAPDYPEARQNLEKLGRIISQYGDGIDRLKTAVEQQPDNPELLYQLARISQAAGMTDQAIAEYERALSLAPGQPDHLSALGYAYAAAGRIADAAGAFEKLAETTPDNPAVYYNLACLYARQNEKEKAVAALRTAVDRGYNRWEHLKADPDLENIHDTEYYRELIGNKR